jgi:DNA polymerase-4
LEVLREQIGEEAEHYQRLAHGLDDRPVTTDHEAKSIGQEQTFDTDLGSPDAVRRILLEQVEQVARRLRQHGYRARSITVKIRFGDFQTITRSSTLTCATHGTMELAEAALVLFDRWVSASFQPVRLIGVTAAHFASGEGQLELFADPQREKQAKLDAATDAIAAKFGKGAIRRGGTLGALE